MHLLKAVLVLFIFYNGCISVNGSPVERFKTVIETMELVVKTLAKKAVDELDKVDCNGDSNDGDDNDNDGDGVDDGDDIDVDVLPEHRDYQDCYQIQNLTTNKLKNGVYSIVPRLWGKPVDVYCDFTTEGGGWTLIQRRDNYTVQKNFYRNWKDYQNGFGNVTEDFWIGNDIIHALTYNTTTTLRIELEDWESNVVYAEYTNFFIENLDQKYKLKFGEYSGNAGDSLARQKGHIFSTFDSYESNCAVARKGAWWYEMCTDSNLNGVYNGTTLSQTGITWYHWKNEWTSLKRTEMKIRSMEF